MLQGVQWRLVLQRSQRVTIVKPAGEGSQHDDQPAWIAAGIVLPQREFHRIEGGGHGLGIQAVPGQIAQGIHDQRFDLTDPGRFHAAQARGKIWLPRMLLVSGPGQVIAQSRLHQRLAQRRGCRADQNVLKHLKRQGGFSIGGLPQNPVNGNEVGAVGVFRPRGVVMF